jgi:hypothetical protein
VVEVKRRVCLKRLRRNIVICVGCGIIIRWIGGGEIGWDIIDSLMDAGDQVTLNRLNIIIHYSVVFP